MKRRMMVQGGINTMVHAVTALVALISNGVRVIAAVVQTEKYGKSIFFGLYYNTRRDSNTDKYGNAVFFRPFGICYSNKMAFCPTNH